MNDEGALVFNHESGATSFVDSKALLVLEQVGILGVVMETALFQAVEREFDNRFNFDSVVSLLEKSRLLIRC